MMHLTVSAGLAHDEATDTAMANTLAAGDRSAILLWLRHATCTPATRRRLAYEILRRSTFTQARLLGVVDCAGCAWPLSDGCELCRPTVPDRLTHG